MAAAPPPRPRRRRRLLAVDGVEIQTPAANRHHTVAAGSTSVVGEAGANVIKVWLKVLRQADAVPAVPTAAAGWVEVAPANGQFSSDAVPGALTTALTGSSDNKAVAIPQLQINPATFGTPNVVYFVGRPTQETRDISARDCIWFAFADAGLTGPDPQNDTEADTANHKPFSLVVPENADKMKVRAVGNWRHFADDPATESDADGRNLVETALERPGYRDGKFRSEGIDDLRTNVGKLIGMFVDVDEVPLEDNPFPIGKAPADVVIPEDVRRLYLAFHDGKRWHNNGGAVTVTIDWVLAANFFRRRGS